MFSKLLIALRLKKKPQPPTPAPMHILLPCRPDSCTRFSHLITGHENTAIGTADFLKAQGGSLDERGVATAWVRVGNVDVPQFSPKKTAA